MRQQIMGVGFNVKGQEQELAKPHKQLVRFLIGWRQNPGLAESSATINTSFLFLSATARAVGGQDSTLSWKLNTLRPNQVHHPMRKQSPTGPDVPAATSTAWGHLQDM